jgi:hypothetical protein
MGRYADAIHRGPAEVAEVHLPAKWAAPTTPEGVPARPPSVEQLVAQYRRQPNPLVVGQRGTITETAVVPLIDDGQVFPCKRCGHDGYVWAHALVTRVHADRKGVRAFKTGAAVASGLLLGFGMRRRQFADVSIIELECPKCGALRVPDLGVDWEVLSPTRRAEIGKELN